MWLVTWISVSGLAEIESQPAGTICPRGALDTEAGDTYVCRPSLLLAASLTDSPSGIAMRSKTPIILGAPFACWGLFSCLTLLGQNADVAGIISVIWGALWLALVHFRRPPHWTARDRRVAYRRGGRTVWNSAVLASLFLPLPVYFIALFFQHIGIAQVTLTVPLFAVLGFPAPATLWWMALWPVADRDEVVLVPMGWRHYTPDAPAGVIPPRNSGLRRAV